MSTPPTTRVDTEQLEAAIRQLEQIKQFLEKNCLGALPAVQKALGSASNVDMHDAEYQITREATAFGAFYSAYGMQAKNDSVYRSVDTSVRDLIQQMDSAAANLRTIINNYQSTDDAYLQSGQNFNRQLDASTTTDGSGGGVMYA